MPGRVLYLLPVALTIAALATAAGAHGAVEAECERNSAIVGPCFAVGGRLSIAANLRPYLRATGTGRLIGIAAPDGAMIMPTELKALFKGHLDQQAVGEFLVCPFTPYRRGTMQLACIARFRAATPEGTRPHEPSAALLHREIREIGAKAVVARLWRAPSDHPYQGWLGFERRVASGAPEWLSVAQELADATDAGQTHGLSIALHHALSRNPQAVLRLLPHPPFSIEAVCADGNDEEAAAAEARELRAILPAVSRVRAPSLRNVRDQCLGALHEALRLTTPSN